MNIVLFCGGRGSTALIKELVRWPEINLSLIVNAYDDGLSTGAIRRAIPGFLGPSDFRKNLVSTLLQSGEQHLEIAAIMEHRLKIQGQAITNLDQLLMADKEFAATWKSLRDSRKVQLERYAVIFLRYLEKNSVIFEFEDCAVGNIIYAGAYLAHDHNFQLANSELCNIIGVNASIISVSNEDTHLAGVLSDGTVLRNESSIVNLKSQHTISEIFLIQKALTEKELRELNDTELENRVLRLRNKSKIPEATLESKQAIENADLVIYGSGTQHSSLFPSYMVLGKNGIRPRQGVPKIFIANLEWDLDIQGWSLGKLLNKFQDSWGAVPSDGLVTHVLVDQKSPFSSLIQRHDSLNVFQTIHANLRSNSDHGVHSGYVVYREIQRIIQGSRDYESDGILFVISLSESQMLREKILINEITELEWPEEVQLLFKYSNAPESEILSQYKSWCSYGSTRYFIGLTGHGQYSIGDILPALQSMNETMCALTYGNRFRTRNEWILAKKTAFEEKRTNQIIATLGSQAVNFITTVKFRKTVSDPFSRIFIIDRLNLPKGFCDIPMRDAKSVLGLYAHFWKNSLLSSEFQVKFRATYGESSDRKHVLYGIRELWNLLRL